MSKFFNKLSPTQVLVINALLSLLGTAIVSAICVSYQYYTEHGKIDIGTLINYTLITFLVLFGKALHDYVPAHAQQIIQALDDAYQQSQESLHTAIQALASHDTSQPQQAAPAPAQAVPLPSPVPTPIATGGTMVDIDPLALPESALQAAMRVPNAALAVPPQFAKTFNLPPAAITTSGWAPMNTWTIATPGYGTQPLAEERSEDVVSADTLPRAALGK